MANRIKGLTVEIGGDTSKLVDALADVNKKSRELSSELGDVNRLLKLDPGNADLVAQKQKILADAVENTKSKLDTLREAEKQVQAQFERGEVSAEQVRALQREIVATEQKLAGYEKAAKEVADGNDSIARSAKEAGDASEDLSGTLDNIANTGLAAVAGVVTSAVTGLTAAAEASREYRTEMGKLDAAFTASSHTSETAYSAYKNLVGVIGETDQSVEAAQQIALLAESEKDVAQWADLAAGVVGTFGDALQPETFFEAANETMKLGEATGAYVQMLEGTGMSVEEFNKGLEDCNTEAEKQAYMLDITKQALGAAGEAYKQNNADIIAANEANEAWQASMAELGAVVEPFLTQVKSVGATLLSDIVPVVQTLLNNLPAIGTALAGITASMIAFKVAAIAATAAQNGMTLAQYAAAAAQRVLNAAMSANPIGLIILAITALVTAFMLLWKNCDGFREFWINLWDNIKSTVSAVVDWFKTVPDRISSAISGTIAKVRTWGNNLLNVAKKAATAVLNGLFTIYVKIPMKIWSAIFGAIAKVVQWGAQMTSKAKTAATNTLNGAINTLKNMPSKVWAAIQSAVAKVKTWGTNMKNAAKTAATNVVSAVTNGLKNLPSKVLSIGSDLVSGLWNGVSNKLSWLKSKISGFASSVLDSIKDFFGVHSPSTETAWIGDMLDEGLAEGVLDNAGKPVSAMQKVTGGVLDAAAKNVNGLTLGNQLQNTFPGSSSDGGLGEKLDRILTAIERGQILTIDGDMLVGATADRFDRRLGQRRMLAARGAL